MALETAIHQAILTERQGALRTKYVHSEILLVLNPGNNVGNGHFGSTTYTDPTYSPLDLRSYQTIWSG
jgi:hypothetical protein